jgi:hypothetical protein
MHGMSRWGAVVLVALAFPGLVEAAPRISLAPIQGDGGAARKQLAAALCGTYDCVPISRVRTGGKLDFGKVRKLKLTGIVAGTVAKRGRSLELALLTRSRRPVWRRSYPLARRGILAPDTLLQATQDLGDQLGGAVPPAAAPLLPEQPPPVAPAPLPPSPAPTAPAPAAPPPTTRLEPVPVAPPPPAAEPARLSPPAERVARSPGGRRLLVAVEAGAHLTQRKLGYDGVPSGATALRGYTADFVGSPRLRLEVFPLAVATDSVLSGLGLFGEYGFSIGLKSKDSAAGAAEHSTSLTRLQAGLLWRIRPLSSSRFALIPAVSFQQLKFTVDPLNNVTIAGLPNSNLSGFKGALGADIPLGDAVSLLAAVGYLKWTTAKDLVQGDVKFFPGGSAYALEAEAGFSVALFGPLSLRVLGEYSRTKYSLDPDPTGTYAATGATEEYLGGRLMLRAEF